MITKSLVAKMHVVRYDPYGFVVVLDSIELNS
jgi:hypothetical protein